MFKVKNTKKNTPNIKTLCICFFVLLTSASSQVNRWVHLGVFTVNNKNSITIYDVTGRSVGTISSPGVTNDLVVTAADIDGNLLPEIVAARPASGINTGDGNINIYGTSNIGNRFPSAGFILPKNGRLTAGDVDGDGRDEIIVASPASGINTGDGIIRIYGDHTAGNRFPSVGFILPENGRLATGDVDGDGRDEIIVARPASGINTGDGIIRIYGDHTAGSRFPLSGFVLPQDGQLATGDVDGDGRDEIIVARPESGINTGDGIIKIFGDHTAGTRFPTLGFILPQNGQLTAGDVDGDGRDEIIAGRRSSGINTGDGNIKIYGDYKYSGFSTLNNQMQKSSDILILSKGDADLDGLLDAWEINGFDADNDGIPELDLPAWGANPRHKDIFLELDWMQNEAPNRIGIQAIKTAFALAPIDAGGNVNPDGLPGINLHIDTGTLTDASGILVGDNLGGGNQVSTTPVCELNGVFYNIKTNNFDSNRALIFRYALSADDTGCPRSGGQGEIGGNDFLDLNHDPGTIMHELGHNLNLQHGGLESVNCKPNYLSVMNYDYQFGIPRNPGRGGQDFDGDGLLEILDFSPPRFQGGRGTSSIIALEEDNLDETIILDPTDNSNQVIFTDQLRSKIRTAINSRIDWNTDGDTNDSNVTVNINNANLAGNPQNCFNIRSDETLSGFDDWSNIVLNLSLFGDSKNSAINPVLEHEPSLIELQEHRESIVEIGNDKPKDKRIQYGFHVGMTAPINKDLDDSSDANIYAAFDFNYRLTDLFNLKLQTGIMQLTAEIASDQEHPRWYFITSNIEIDLPRPGYNWKPYFSAGPGVYFAKDNSTDIGVNVGFGIKSTIYKETQFDVGINYHAINEEFTHHLLALHLGFRMN